MNPCEPGSPVNHYEIWCNLRDSHRDMEFVQNVRAYLGHLQEHGKIAAWRLTRRKFGFGPPELGEFHITISCETLAQLDEAFTAVAPRSGELEKLHARVYSMVTDFRAGLYRDFPDPQRA
ncbi:MAG TPA: DUF6614 family protein [Phycisphaerae bacterium]|nr:DUF6614 family protein [Phycisphaerae bacterium]